MCKCKVCSDKAGYEKLMSQLDDLLHSGNDFDYQKANEITKQLDGYEAYWYEDVGSCSIAVFLYNGGEEFDYENYKRYSTDTGAMRNFNYCPMCGRKLN